MNGRILRPGSGGWPKGLDELGGASPVKQLNLIGRPLPPLEKAIAVVGTRRPTAAGVQATRIFSKGLVEAGFVVVSGLAMGLDAIAHTAALEAGGHTVAVIGCGLDVVYPRQNARLRETIVNNGSIVSEYDAGTMPHKANFPQRNRIIAGLCQGVIVVEGSLQSGALITARHALDANRHVWAVPGSSRNPMATGPNELIRTGQAGLVTGIEHVFEDLAPRLVWDDAHETTEAPDLRPDDAAVLSALDDTPTAIDLIMKTSRLDEGRVAMALMRLEVRGYALRRSAGYLLTEGGARARSAYYATLCS